MAILQTRWLALAALFLLAACRGDVPPVQADAAAREQQKQAFVEALKPRRPGKPVVAVLARNKATETTDFLLTHAVLKRSGVAEVHAIAPQRGRVSLYPALEVEVAEDLAAFDKARPDGPDYVIVPAMLYEEDQDPAIDAWLRKQAERGARLVSVCAGALVVAHAGLLDGRRFTTHWFFRERILEAHPKAVYVPHQRYVVDRDVATSTGITASVPTMLALVEAIGGREKAAALAAELGVDSWMPVHDSNAYGLSFERGFHYLLAKAAFWRNDRRAVDVSEGMDDIALAFAADAWSRTGHVEVVASAPGPVKLRSGLILAAQPAPEGTPRISLAASAKPVEQLGRTLCEIEERFGAARREWTMVELEYGATPPCAAGA
ncbi:MAG TPA: DJ-1/PfpI family protein [Burkholderiales bacterium]|nr:DJ-1/PfpI family protein [Burkholderiales bacterium]